MKPDAMRDDLHALQCLHHRVGFRASDLANDVVNITFVKPLPHLKSSIRF